MQDDDNTGKIGVVDFTLPKPTEKKDNSLLENQSTREDFINNTLTKDKIFTFSLFSKNTIVKDFSLDVKLTSKSATLVNYANNTNILDSVNNPTDAKDLGLLAFSLLFKADKVEKSIENKKGKDKNKPNSVVKDLLFPTQKDLDGDGTPDGKGLGTDASGYSDDGTIRPLLNDNGIIILGLPNHNSYDAKTYQENWVAYDLPIHLSHFTRADILKLVDDLSFNRYKHVPASQGAART